MAKISFGRKDRLIKEKRHDAYHTSDKLPEPTVCNECGALFITGRWTWKEAPAGAHTTTCPACRRISQDYPAGIIELKGPFLRIHREEILNLIHNVELQEKGERPLERIMKIREHPELTTVTTTGVHLARRIGEALSRSYNGNFSFTYADGEKNIRVYWER